MTWGIYLKLSEKKNHNTEYDLKNIWKKKYWCSQTTDRSITINKRMKYMNIYLHDILCENNFLSN